jgi:hypothetical protein
MEAVTWRWGDEQYGEMAHAGIEGQAIALCGATAITPMLHGPFFSHRCPRCESLRAGRLEVFPNPFAARNRALRKAAAENEEEF